MIFQVEKWCCGDFWCFICMCIKLQVLFFSSLYCLIKFCLSVHERCCSFAWVLLCFCNLTFYSDFVDVWDGNLYWFVEFAGLKGVNWIWFLILIIFIFDKTCIVLFKGNLHGVGYIGLYPSRLNLKNAEWGVAWFQIWN